MKTIQDAREPGQYGKPRLCHLYREAIEFFIRWTDPRTGLLMQPARSCQPAQSMMMNNLPLFKLGDPSETDAGRHKRMDQSVGRFWEAGPHQECLYASPALRAYVGRGLEHFLEFSWAGLIHPQDREWTRANCTAGFSTRQMFWLSYRLQRADGMYGWIFDQAQPRFQPDGTFAGYIGTLHEYALADAHGNLIMDYRAA